VLDREVAQRPATEDSALTTPPESADEIFLEGPRSRFDEFVTLLSVMRDFLRGFRVLHFVGPCVTVFGSARIKIDNPRLCAPPFLLRLECPSPLDCYE
jgi:hypothetical protein